MKESSRATIAYIAGRVVNNSNSSSVYDYNGAGHISISGKIDNSRINIYNYDKGCHFSGNGNNSKILVQTAVNSNNSKLLFTAD